MSEPERLVVVIPARNESRLIGRCLDSIAYSAADLRATSPIAIDVVVVADGCTDDTEVLASSREGVTVVSSAPVGVGAARRLGVRRAFECWTGSPERLWLASTDADSRVDVAWLRHQFDAACSGADVRIGAVRPDFRDLSGPQIMAWERTHRDGARRGHVHGANLGIRGSTYLAAGGFHPLLIHEDVDLVQRARELHAVVSIGDVADVITSGRPEGRAPGGYANYLSGELLTSDEVLVGLEA